MTKLWQRLKASPLYDCRVSYGHNFFQVFYDARCISQTSSVRSRQLQKHRVTMSIFSPSNNDNDSEPRLDGLLGHIERAHTGASFPFLISFSISPYSSFSTMYAPHIALVKSISKTPRLERHSALALCLSSSTWKLRPVWLLLSILQDITESELGYALCDSFTGKI